MTIENKAYNQILKYAEILKENGIIQTTNISRKTYNFEFSVQHANSKLKVQVYFGKKGPSTVLQGDKNSGFYSTVRQLLQSEPELFAPSDSSEPKVYVGTDESGKGDIFGPLAVAAFFVTEDIKSELKSIGIADSKTLSDFRINRLSSFLRENFRNNYHIISLEPKVYNEKYAAVRNLNKLLAALHLKAVYELSKSFNFTDAIIDKFQNKNLDINESAMFAFENNAERNNFVKKLYGIKLYETTKAERFIGVAAASILARAEMNKWFSLNADKGFPKGASAAAENFAEKFIREYPRQSLKNYAKIHFKTFSKFR